MRLLNWYASGKLGVTVSSERYKTAIAAMGVNSAKLQQARPVIAEEVAKVYPELVIRNEAGRIDGIRYDELAPMLLNEVQQQQRKIDAQAAEIRDVKQQLAELKGLKQDLHAALLNLQAKDELAANR
jgi:trimeric autotransporter adhesin